MSGSVLGVQFHHYSESLSSEKEREKKLFSDTVLYLSNMPGSIIVESCYLFYVFDNDIQL